MRNYDICIIGGGASGLAAAASLSSHFHTVLLEKNGILGRKIMATGGGRCNITNTACAHCDLTLDFFKSLGMELYHDTEGRYYPYSNQARDVARVLEEAALEKGDVEAAKDIARNTRGPIASIYYQGLMRIDQGIDVVEKSVVSYGGVQAGYLEKGCSWITLFIAMAPSLGFLGTVIGMVQAFDKIQQVGDISPTVVAGGMKVALITTIFGLIVALILQVFYNYILAKIEALTSEMEDSSISLLDMVIKYDLKYKK